MSKTAIIIQARMGSTRFPNKMTVPFYREMGILAYILNRLTHADICDNIVLAIPNSSTNDVLEDIGRSFDLKVFRGSENNVLERFIGAATTFNITKAIRLCADNPFIDLESLQTLTQSFEKSEVDYLAYALPDNTPSIKTHFGFWAEAVKVSALERIAQLNQDKLFQEHVTNFIYSNPALFQIEFLPIPKEIAASTWARFTVDTESDFLAMSSIAERFGPDENPNPEQLIRLVAQHPEMKQKMRLEIEKNSKT